MNIFYQGIGIRIRELRELNRYTREKFAEIADISPKFLYEIETGQKGFSADTLYRISKGLCVNCEYILTGKTDPVNEDIINTVNLFNAAQSKLICELLKTLYELISISEKERVKTNSEQH